MKFDHVGILVANPKAGRQSLSAAFGIERWTAEFSDPVNDVIVQFGLDPGGMCYETVSPLSGDGPITRSLAQRVNIVNHTAYLVTDLAEQRERLRRLGFIATSEPKPAVAYGGKSIQFFLSRAWLLFELIEAPDHHHLYL